MALGGPRVAVVGAGVAGIGAAHGLARAGAEVVLVERAALGGRAREAVYDGFRVEAAPLVAGTRDRRLLALGEALAPGLPLLRPTQPAEVDGEVLRPLDESDPRGVLRLSGVPLRQRLRLVRLGRLEDRFAALLDADHPEHAVRLDDRSVADFARLYFGPAVLERWIEPELASALGLRCAETSRVALLRQRQARAGALLGRLRTSVPALAAALGPAVRRVAGDARAIRPSGAGYEVALSGGGCVEAEAIVLATPPAEVLRCAGELLAEAEGELFAASSAEAAVVASFALAGAWTHASTWVRVSTGAGLPIAAVAIEPGVAGGFAPAGKTLVQITASPAWSAAHLEAPDDAIARSLGAALERMRPAAGDALELLEVARFEWARPRFDVGRYRALARLFSVQRDQRARGRRLYFAGDYLNAPTLEGAAASGARAASSLLADFGVG